MVGVIQARMGSSRLPGKVLSDIAGRPMLAHVIERTAQIDEIDEVVVATTDLPEDEVVLEVAREFGAGAFAGSPSDVLDRYYLAAKQYEADVVMRVTADCPLLDPIVGDHVTSFYKHGQIDYCGNLLPPTYPDGVNIEIVSFRALEKSWNHTTLSSDREHVTTYIRTHPDEFSIINVESPENMSHMRWTVDEPADLEFIRQVFSHLRPAAGETPGVVEVLKVLAENPELALLNTGFERGAGWERSIAADAEAESRGEPQ